MLSKSFINRFNEENNVDNFWTLNRKLCIVGVLVLFVIIFAVTGCTKNNTEQPEASLPAESEEIVADEYQDTVNVGDDGVNAAIAPDDTSKNSNKMVSMSVEDLGRADPFLPYGNYQSSGSLEGIDYKASYDLVPPPESITVDPTATDVITTKVSGIMYDSHNPSAIIKIADSDYLVRTGDVVNGYKILSIGRDTVTVQNGANVYKAGVGELFADGEIHFNTVSNLQNKFGGNKNAFNKR